MNSVHLSVISGFLLEVNRKAQKPEKACCNNL